MSSKPDPATEESAPGDVPAPAPSSQSLETLVRSQLAKALGGTRGMVEGAVPTLGFTVCWIISRDLRLSLVISGALAVVLLLLRIVQRSSVQFVLNSIVGIAIAAVFALRSGRAEDAFLPGVIYNAVYAVVLAGSALVRWPFVGFMIGGVTGDLTRWHQDRHLVSLCSRLTLVLALPCVLRVIVQYPLYRMHEAGWLGFAKLAMGWPLQIAALAAMVWLLSRDDTRVPVASPRT
ncbi:MAG: hypothetical protein QOI51_2584 [Nocardioidaceae bacterium]|jgi:hypothetical protein|nr:hypothetical protein [Nocardioidaceae bacterium]MDX6308141.1 hypothetical protein [Nocardioidaceae bacterium]